MRIILSLGTLGLGLLFAVPASAQMCAGGQGGGMCGMTPTQAQQPQGQAPAAAPNQSTPQQAGCGCACCRNMAMMGQQGGQSGGQQGGRDGAQPQRGRPHERQRGGGNMPSMNMPRNR